VPGDAPRVRFAPSPTGYFHVGSARTAWFNWLVARQAAGSFVLRIEDTDTERGREEWVGGIISAMHWLGMDPDEGPFRQSARTDRYAQAIEALWGAGRIYACDCTRDEIDARNKAKGILTPGYDGFCRDRSLARVGADGEGRALRFRTPDIGTTTVSDVIRGEVAFPNDAMDDFVLVKASGAPLFVLANVVDDIDMSITHVIRGEDLLPTTPKGVLVWEALGSIGWVTDGSTGVGAALAPPLPVFAHLPMLVNEQRKKLSKRRDPVAVESYRDQGYLPGAFVNYLSLLGWSPPGGEEVFDVDQALEWFRLENVNHSPAFFDVVKLTHMNGEYIRAMPIDSFIESCQPWLTGEYAPWPASSFDEAAFAAMAPLVQERVAVLGEVPAMVDFLFVDPVIDDEAWTKAVATDELAVAILSAAIDAYAGLADGWTRDALHESTLAVAEGAGRKLGKAQAPIRVAVTGRRVGPPLFEALEVLGPERTLARLRVAQERAAAEAGPVG
jgi:glutamyl-tRNA synthetase